MSTAMGVVHGITAALACAAGFSLTGLALTPVRWRPLLGGASFCVIGAAAYVVICLVAVTAWGIPLTGLTAVFAVGVAALAFLRLAHVKAAVSAPASYRACVIGSLAFAGFYVLAYGIASLPADDPFPSLASVGHADLVTHARYAKSLLLRGTTDLETATFDFRRAPAVPVLLAAFSTFYRDDPLSAVLPLQLAAAALVGAAAFSIGRNLFRLPTAASLAIACIAVTSTYVSDIATPHGLETALAVPIALHLIHAAARTRSDALGALALSFGCGAALLLLSNAALFPVSAGFALAIVALAAVARVAIDADWQVRCFPAPADRRLVSALTVYVAVGLLIANVAAHASARRRAPARIPASWKNIEMLKERAPRELTLKLTRDPGGLVTAVTRYYLPAARLHVVRPGARPDYRVASRENPLLIQNFGCEGVGHADTLAVPEVGCALLAPPSLALDTAYPFTRTFLAVAFDNMSDREPEGRWSTGRRLRLTLTIDSERTSVERDLHVNLLVNPSPLAGAGPQRLAITWGARKKAEWHVAESGWVSIPVGAGDWSGDRLRALPIVIDFPDGRAMLFQELSVSGIARGNAAG